MSDDGKRAYVNNYGSASGVGSGNGTTVSVVDLITNQIIDTIKVGLAPAALVLSPDNEYLYVVDYVDGEPGTGLLVIVSTATNTVIDTIPGFSGPFAIALSKYGRYTYITNFGSNNFAPFGTTVSAVDLKLRTIIKNITTGIQPSGITVSPCGEYAYSTNYNALYAKPNFQNLTYELGSISIIRLRDNKLVAPTIPVGQIPSSIAVSPDGSRLFVTNYVMNVVTEVPVPCHLR